MIAKKDPGNGLPPGIKTRASLAVDSAINRRFKQGSAWAFRENKGVTTHKKQLGVPCFL